MTTIRYVPPSPDPHAVLAEGPCGARPPLAYRDEAGRLWVGRHAVCPTGIVLAWGALVPEGMDRLVHRLGAREGMDMGSGGVIWRGLEDADTGGRVWLLSGAGLDAVEYAAIPAEPTTRGIPALAAPPALAPALLAAWALAVVAAARMGGEVELHATP